MGPALLESLMFLEELSGEKTGLRQFVQQFVQVSVILWIQCIVDDTVSA